MSLPEIPIAIRSETSNDYFAIRAVVTAAFGRPEEAKLVSDLRSDNALTVALVAEAAGQILGHIAFSPVQIVSANQQTTALALAPVAVHPEWQRRGIGGDLIRAGLAAARGVGHDLVVLLGHAEYYPRFGFVPAGQYGIECPFPVPPEVWMVAELIPGAVTRHRGMVQYHVAFSRL